MRYGEISVGAVERCLTCEAVVSKATALLNILARAASYCLPIETTHYGDIVFVKLG